MDVKIEFPFPEDLIGKPVTVDGNTIGYVVASEIAHDSVGAYTTAVMAIYASQIDKIMIGDKSLSESSAVRVSHIPNAN